MIWGKVNAEVVVDRSWHAGWVVYKLDMSCEQGPEQPQLQHMLCSTHHMYKVLCY